MNVRQSPCMEPAEIYRRMILIRETEERIRTEYHKDEIKTPCHLAVGAEAIAVGVVSQMPEGTKYFGTYRNHHLYFAVNGDMDGFWGELYGKETGCAKGKAGSMHLSDPDRGLVLTSAVVGTTIPIALGSAKAGYTTVVFFGDGATEEGVFHESLNFAALHKLPILFVCEDNGLAIHTSKAQRQNYDLERFVDSYEIPFWEVDGSLLDAVITGTKELLRTDGPMFLHAKYHRFYEHVGPNEDYDVGYRIRPSEFVDPIENLSFSKLLISISVPQREEIRAQVLRDIDNAVERAKAAKFPGPEELMKDVFE